jgi:hypothetical protein
MYLDAKLDFGTPAISNSNTATISTNVFNAGEQKLLFRTEPGDKVPKLFYSFDVSADCSGAKVDFHATDESDGDVDASEDTTEVVASTGVLKFDYLGDALGTGTQRVEGYLPLTGQVAARQYYAATLALSGTNPDATAGDAYVVWDAQTNMVGARAAVPA